ncbi:DUF6064 family protein [Marinobacter sp. F4218]|uniref:DUF6064 family protein n=1 Tax=Marinobacter sp. F4218 TaxID=2862868 RepID=UPI001C637D7B|nr:DUF6064 family protein [Marinobacter sp. F4218]MBW7472697.1 hypothetical protein [Marinobacter sp. F4218]
MSDPAWLSYSLQDFLMFGPEVFLRLFARINQDLWPWQLLVVPLSLIVPWMAGRPEIVWRRLALVIVAAAWILSGGGFLVNYFGEINWPAVWIGWAFTVQGGLLAALAVTRGCPRLSIGRTGWFAAFWLAAVVLLPWLTVVQSGEPTTLALFGLSPGVTVAASVLLVGGFGRATFWLLLPVPITWVLFSTATYWALQTQWLLLLPLATLASLVAGVWLSPRPVQSPGPQSAHHGPVRR